MSLPSVAVVVLNYNTHKLLQQFLPSIAATTYPNVRFIVADNGSNDNSESIVNQFDKIEWLPLGNNFGYAEGYNIALNQIDADYYVLLNSDVEVTPNWLEPLVEYALANSDFVALQPKIKSFHNKEYFEYAGASGGFIDQLGYPYCRGRIFDICEKDEGQYDNAIEIFWASGAALFIKSEAFKAVGGLDKRLFAHMEEIDLCWRLKLMGYKIACVPQSVVYHVGGGTLSAQNSKKTYLNFRNSLVLLARYNHGMVAFYKVFLRMILDGPAALLFLLKGRPSDVWAIAKAHWNFIFNFQYWTKNKLSPTIIHHNDLTGNRLKSIAYKYYVKGIKKFSELSTTQK